jgi:hypothetical protein
MDCGPVAGEGGTDMSIEFTLDDKELKAMLDNARRNLSPAAQDKLVEKTAWQARTDLINLTPHRSGGTAGAWQINGSRGERKVINTSAVMRFLEKGTPENNPGSKIYPKHAKALAIPLLAAGRRTSMTQTVRDKSKRKPGSASRFSFVAWVHGIKPMRIVEKYMPKAAERLVANVIGAFQGL